MHAGRSAAAGPWAKDDAASAINLSGFSDHQQVLSRRLGLPDRQVSEPVRPDGRSELGGLWMVLFRGFAVSPPPAVTAAVILITTAFAPRSVHTQITTG